MSSDFPKTLEHCKALMGQLGDSIPNTMAGFSRLHHAATNGKGTLDTKTKELIALGIAIAIRCEGCIAFHVHDALAAGASEQDILDTIGVAILMGGGPAVIYGCEAFEAMKQFEVTPDELAEAAR